MRRVALLALVCVCAGSLAWGQEIPGELLRVKIVGDDSTACAGRMVERGLAVLWDFMTDDSLPEYGVQGWSFGVLLENSGAAASYIKTATEHPDTAVIRETDRPDFDTINYFEAADLVNSAGSTDDGTGLEGEYIAVTQGVVVDFGAKLTLPAPQSDYGALLLTVVITGDDVGATAIGFTKSVGSPPTKTVAVAGGGSFVPAEQVGITIEILSADDPTCQSDFLLVGDDAMAQENILAPRSDIGEASVVRTISLLEEPKDPSAAASPVQALSLSLRLPAGITVDVGPGEDVQTAEYFTVVAEEGCISAGLIMEFELPFDPANVIEALTPAAAMDLNIATIAENWLNVETPADLELVLDDCTTPPVASVVVVDGESRAIANQDFVLLQKVVPVTQLPFTRGDANADGKLDVADAIFTIDWLFRVGPEPDCLDAADVDDSNSHEVTDVILLLSYLFDIEITRDGEVFAPIPPAAPFPDCGLDETGGTAQSCLKYEPCE